MARVLAGLGSAFRKKPTEAERAAAMARDAARYQAQGQVAAAALEAGVPYSQIVGSLGGPKALRNLQASGGGAGSLQGRADMREAMRMSALAGMVEDTAARREGAVQAGLNQTNQRIGAMNQRRYNQQRAAGTHILAPQPLPMQPVAYRDSAEAAIRTPRLSAILGQRAEARAAQLAADRQYGLDVFGAQSERLKAQGDYSTGMANLVGAQNAPSIERIKQEGAVNIEGVRARSASDRLASEQRFAASESALDRKAETDRTRMELDSEERRAAAELADAQAARAAGYEVVEQEEMVEMPDPGRPEIMIKRPIKRAYIVSRDPQSGQPVLTPVSAIRGSSQGAQQTQQDPDNLPSLEELMSGGGVLR